VAFKNVEIALRLQTAGFTAGLGAVSAQTRALGKQISDDLGNAPSRSIEQIGKVSLVAGGAILAGFGLAAHATMDFDKTLSDLQSVTGSTGAQMEVLRQQALDAGAATTFSASEAAQAQVELAKAGVSTADILGGALDGALNLAAAGNLDLATAATYAANAMTTFGLAGQDVEHIADVLAAAANKSAVDVSDIGTALQQSGLVAAQFGLTLDDTVGVLAAFGQAGLKGSDAGTSLKTMLQRLGGPTVTAANEMERLGIDMFDATGSFIGIEAAAGELQTALSGLTEEQRAAAMQTIFGADAVRAATILFTEGEEGIGGWVDQVNDSGYAAEVAAQKTDNLAGDLEELGGALETALIEQGDKSTGVLRALAEGATDTVRGFSAMPPVVQNVGTGIAGIAAVGLTAAGVVGTLAPKVRELKTALEGLGTAGQFASRNLGVGAFALGGIGGIALGVAHMFGQAERAGADLRQELIEDIDTKSLDSIEAGLAGARDRLREVEQDWTRFEGAGGFARGVAENTKGILGFGSAMAETSAEMEAARDVQQELVRASNLWTSAIQVTSVALGVGHDEAERWLEAINFDPTAANGGYQQIAADVTAAKTAMENGTPASDALGASLGTLADETSTATDRLQAYADAMDAVIGVHLSSFEAATAFGGAITGLTEQLAGGNLSLDEFTENGQANRDALSGAAQAAIDHALAIGEEQGSVEAANMVLAGHVTQLTDVMRQAGLTDEQIAMMITQMGLTPENIETLLALNGTQQAGAALDAHQRNLSETPGRTSTDLTAFDRASATIFGVQSALAGIPREVQVRITAFGASAVQAAAQAIRDQRGQRWGGIHEYAQGGIHGGIQAHVARGDVIRYAEPETGGEAFIPRIGNRARSLSILEEAAGWYGMDLMDKGASKMGVWGGQSVTVQVSQVVADDLSPMGRVRMERSVQGAVTKAVAAVTGL